MHKTLRYETGSFAISKAGHEKGEIFIICKEESEYVYLVDGKSRKLGNPKKKKKKHVQPVLEADENLYMKIQTNAKIIDEEIKRAIKCYKTTSMI